MTATSAGPLVTLPVDEVRRTLDEALAALGFAADEVPVVAEHLLDCELRGLAYGGLARLLSIAERLAAHPGARGPITVAREGPSSALLDGADAVGYLVGQRATDLAVAKAAETGLALVGAHRTWYTGMLSFYAEQATRQGLVVLIASHATPWVAPHGATEPRYGTNPICFGFPGGGADGANDVVWDIGTSDTTHAEVVLARRRGAELPLGGALDAQGRPTTDPDAALEGAFTAWGGPRGSGLGLVVQMLGMLAGAPAAPGELADFGFLVAVWSPDLLGPAEAFADRVGQYADWVRSAAGVDGGAVRMPFDRSRRRRAEVMARGHLDVDADVLAAVRGLAGGGPFS